MMGLTRKEWVSSILTGIAFAVIATGLGFEINWRLVVFVMILRMWP